MSDLTPGCVLGRTSWHRAMLILGKRLLEVTKAEAVSECQT
jgi:hypothetical protein